MRDFYNINLPVIIYVAGKFCYFHRHERELDSALYNAK